MNQNTLETHLFPSVAEINDLSSGTLKQKGTLQFCRLLEFADGKLLRDDLQPEGQMTNDKVSHFSKSVKQAQDVAETAIYLLNNSCFSARVKLSQKVCQPGKSYIYEAPALDPNTVVTLVHVEVICYLQVMAFKMWICHLLVSFPVARSRRLNASQDRRRRGSISVKTTQ